MSFHNSIRVIEPVRGKQIMIALNNWATKHELLVRLLPWTADIFVFTYPVCLVALYLWGIQKKDTYFQHAAFALAFSAGLATVINQVIQYFGDKVRPETAVLLKENLILSHLPTDPFPSDHAAVSSAIAMSTMLWGMRHHDKRFLHMSIFFWIISGVMSFSRVAVAIHWPTDILVGILVGIISALIMLHHRVWAWIEKYVCTPLIRVQKRLFAQVGR